MEWHPVTLPSKGLYYNGLVPEGKVQISPWTLEQEEMLIRYSDKRMDDMIDLLVSKNVKLPQGFPLDDLLLSDQLFILFQIRVLSLTPFYTVATKCLECAKEWSAEVDLSKLDVTVPDETFPPEPIPCFLPRARVEVGLKQLRVKDSKAITSYAASKPAEKGDPERRMWYVRGIAMIGGQERPFDEKMDFVRGLIMMDLIAIRHTLDKWSTGLNIRPVISCPSCGDKQEVRVGMTAAFFRPGDADIERAISVARPAR